MIRVCLLVCALLALLALPAMRTASAYTILYESPDLFTGQIGLKSTADRYCEVKNGPLVTCAASFAFLFYSDATPELELPVYTQYGIEVADFYNSTSLPFETFWIGSVNKYCDDWTKSCGGNARVGNSKLFNELRSCNTQLPILCACVNGTFLSSRSPTAPPVSGSPTRFPGSTIEPTTGAPTTTPSASPTATLTLDVMKFSLVAQQQLQAQEPAVFYETTRFGMEQAAAVSDTSFRLGVAGAYKITAKFNIGTDLGTFTLKSGVLQLRKNGTVVASVQNQFADDVSLLPFVFSHVEANVTASEVFAFSFDTAQQNVTGVFTVRRIDGALTTFSLNAGVTLPPSVSPVAPVMTTLVRVGGSASPSVGALHLTCNSAGLYVFGLYGSIEVALGATAYITLNKASTVLNSVFLGETFASAATYGFQLIAFVPLEEFDVVNVRWTATGPATSRGLLKGFLHRATEVDVMTFQISYSPTASFTNIQSFGPQPAVVEYDATISRGGNGVHMYELYSTFKVEVERSIFVGFLNFSEYIDVSDLSGRYGYSQVSLLDLWVQDKSRTYVYETAPTDDSTPYTVTNTHFGYVARIGNDQFEDCFGLQLVNTNCFAQHFTSITFNPLDFWALNVNAKCTKYDNDGTTTLYGGVGFSGFQFRNVTGGLSLRNTCVYVNLQNSTQGDVLSFYSERSTAPTASFVNDLEQLGWNKCFDVADNNFVISAINIHESGLNYSFVLECVEWLLPPSTSLTCISYTTPARSLTTDLFDLVEHNVTCPRLNQAIRGFRVVKPTPMTYQFEYSCCQTECIANYRQQSVKFRPENITAAIQFGSSLAISGDSYTAAIGSMAVNDLMGGVWVFHRSGENWMQQGNMLNGSDASGTAILQGYAVAIDRSGSTIAFSAPGDASNGGAVWVFAKNQTSWAQQGNKLVAVGNVGLPNFGKYVSIADDGNTLAVGGPDDDSSTGAAWVFRRVSATWSLSAPKLVSSPSYAGFHYGSVSLSGDGNTVVMASLANATHTCAWVFSRNGLDWNQTSGCLQGTNLTSTFSYGNATAINQRGTLFTVSAPFEFGGKGAFWTYELINGVWTEFDPIRGDAQAFNAAYKGASMDMSAFGDLLAVGSENLIDANRGGVLMYRKENRTWTLIEPYLTANDSTAHSKQGFSVSVSEDAQIVLFSGWTDTSNRGAAWSFKAQCVVSSTFSPTTAAPTPFLYSQQGLAVAAPTLGPSSRLGESVAISGDGKTAFVGARQFSSFTGGSFAFTETGGVWEQQGEMLVGTAGSQQGLSSALSENGTIAAAGGFFNSTQFWRVRVYDRNASGVWNERLPSIVAPEIAETGSLIDVALSAKGNVLVVGSYGNDNNLGAVFVYNWTGAAWVPDGRKIQANDSSSDARQGQSVSVSAAGDVLVFGGYEDNSNNGASWVFRRNASGIWNQDAIKLFGSGATGLSEQGIACAISGDALTIASGGYRDNSFLGAVWIFVYEDGNWQQQGSKLVGTGETGTVWQGGAVALSYDGNILVSGGPDAGISVGAVWVFRRQGGIWAQVGAKLDGTLTGVRNFGYSVAISNQGEVIVVGGPATTSSQGRVWFFGLNITPNPTRMPTLTPTLLPTSKSPSASPTLVPTTTVPSLSPTVSAFQQQGTRVDGNVSSTSISLDGNTVVAGWPGASSTGATRVFTRSEGVWTQFGADLVGSGSVGGSVFQGSGVSISDDGNRFVTGGLGDSSLTGAAWVFNKTNNAWTQMGSKLVGTGNVGAAQQGARVSISGDGLTVAVSGPEDNTFEGAVWIFLFNGTWNQQGAKLVGTNTYAGAIRRGTGVSLSTNGSVVAFVGATDGMWVFTRSGGVWTQLGSVIQPVEGIGNGVAISGDASTIVAGCPVNDTNGVVLIYTWTGSAYAQQGPKLTGTGITASPTMPVNFGRRVSISNNGNSIRVTGRGDASNRGAFWVFNRVGSTWTQYGTKYTSVETATWFGIDISMSRNFTTTAIAGSPGLWVFDVGFTPGPTRTPTTLSPTPPTTFAPTISITNAPTLLPTSNAPTPYAPFIQQGAKYVSGSVTTAGQGSCVAMNTYGNVSAVGARRENAFEGAMLVYKRSGSVWTQEGGKLVGTGASGTAQLGTACDLDEAGVTLVAGGRADNSFVGALWIFVYNGTAWNQQGSKLVGTSGVGTTNQGTNVAIARDGNTVVTGSSEDNSFNGAVWVFVRSGSSWSQQGSKITATASIGVPFFGFDFDLGLANGDYMVIGGPNDNGSRGATWVYTRSGGVWSYVSKLIQPATQGQGTSVKINSDATTLIVGAQEDSTLGGSISIWGRSGSTWSLQAPRTAGTPYSGTMYQGFDVTISGAGNITVFSGPRDASSTGAIWVFGRTGVTWAQLETKILGADIVGSARFGERLQLSRDGQWLIVGAELDNSNAGAVWMFSNNGVAP